MNQGVSKVNKFLIVVVFCRLLCVLFLLALVLSCIELLMIISLVSSNFTYETSAVLRIIKSSKRLRNHLAFKYLDFERI